MNSKIFILGVKQYKIEIILWISAIILVSIQNLFSSTVVILVTEYALSFHCVFGIWAILLPLSLAGVTLGKLFYTLTQQLVVVMTALMSFTGMALMLSGVYWPVEGLEYGLQYASHAFPHRYTIQALRGFTLKQLPMSTPLVLEGIWVPFVWAILTYLLNLFINLIKF